MTGHPKDLWAIGTVFLGVKNGVEHNGVGNQVG